MTPRSLAAASTLAALAAGATWAVWPSKPHVPQPATTHETMRECPSDGGTGPCQMREHVCRWTDSPEPRMRSRNGLPAQPCMLPTQGCRDIRSLF